jgi:uncharacterized YigZ family protein
MEMAKDIYKTIQASSEGVYKEKGSKFLSFLHPVANEEEVRNYIEQYRRKFHDARHVCYAWVIGKQKPYVTRSNDDGEPTGTAGKPMLSQLTSAGLTNVLVIVVRYFGGVLLGTGGLVIAYRTAVANALAESVIVQCTIDRTIRITFDYPLMGEVMRIVKEEKLKIEHQDMGLNCQLTLSYRLAIEEKILERFRLLLKVQVEQCS